MPNLINLNLEQFLLQGINMELVVDKVVKKYEEVVAVNELSFSVSEGEIFALLGPNGAGKSSIIRMMTGFTHPDNGHISVNIDGIYHSSIPAHELGYLPEDRGLYPEKSLVKNILYFARLNGMEKQKALEEIDHWLERFELIERKDDPLKSLSKGNQQKVQLITAVIHQPRWVILDEPFSGLDPVNQEKVVQFLSELTAQGMSVILSAHQMAMVEKLAARILLMNKGKAVFYGKLADFRAKQEANTKISVTFAQNISTAQKSNIPANVDHQWLADDQLNLSVSEYFSVNQLLNLLPSIGEVSDIQSQKLDLHQLYLQAIEEQGASNNA
jgi:ABC-2 type transport system ATP-binding protein